MEVDLVRSWVEGGLQSQESRLLSDHFSQLYEDMQVSKVDCFEVEAEMTAFDRQPGGCKLVS